MFQKGSVWEHLSLLCHRRWRVELQRSFKLSLGNWAWSGTCWKLAVIKGLLSEAKQAEKILIPQLLCPLVSSSWLPTFDGELKMEVEKGMSCLRDAVVTREGVQCAQEWRKGVGSLTYHPILQIIPKALQGVCCTPAAWLQQPNLLHHQRNPGPQAWRRPFPWHRWSQWGSVWGMSNGRRYPWRFWAEQLLSCVCVARAGVGMCGTGLDPAVLQSSSEEMAAMATFQ